MLVRQEMSVALSAERIKIGEAERSTFEEESSHLMSVIQSQETVLIVVLSI